VLLASAEVIHLEHHLDSLAEVPKAVQIHPDLGFSDTI